MKTAIRAYRILNALANYHQAEHTDFGILALAEGRLGDLLGCYRNPAPQEGTIGIFTDGLAWLEAGHPVAIRFSDIVEAELPSGKESQGLVLKLRAGDEVLMPVRGHRGQFYDSMEVLRFMYRVLEDLRKTEVGGVLPT